MSTWNEACAGDEIPIEDATRFDYRTGIAKGAPVYVNLKTYPVKIEGEKVLIDGA